MCYQDKKMNLKNNMQSAKEYKILYSNKIETERLFLVMFMLTSNKQEINIQNHQMMIELIFNLIKIYVVNSKLFLNIIIRKHIIFYMFYLVE